MVEGFWGEDEDLLAGGGVDDALGAEGAEGADDGFAGGVDGGGELFLAEGEGDGDAVGVGVAVLAGQAVQ